MMENKDIDIGFKFVWVVFMKTDSGAAPVVENVHLDMEPGLRNYLEQNGRYIVKSKLCLSTATDASIKELYDRTRVEMDLRWSTRWLQYTPYNLNRED